MNIIHQLAKESERLFFIGDGVYICSNPFFGILFMDVYGDYVFNKAIVMKGGF